MAALPAIEPPFCHVYYYDYYSQQQRLIAETVEAKIHVPPTISFALPLSLLLFLSLSLCLLLPLESSGNGNCVNKVHTPTVLLQLKARSLPLPLCLQLQVLESNPITYLSPFLYPFCTLVWLRSPCTDDKIVEANELFLIIDHRPPKRKCSD